MPLPSASSVRSADRTASAASLDVVCSDFGDAMLDPEFRLVMRGLDPRIHHLRKSLSK
jgi:hypothetical protein